MRIRSIIKSKKGFEMSFAWLFAIIAGAVIIILAIYGTARFVQVSKYRGYTEAAKSLTILIDPLETGIASAVGQIVSFGRETRTFYTCETPTSSNAFGRQTIAFSERSGIGQKWADRGGEITIRNKFIFADNIEEGKNLYLFSKPFYMGFKVSDIVFISSEEYCFVATPTIIRKELEQLAFSLKNINMTDKITDCREASKKVCFGSQTAGCDIFVQGDEQYRIGYVSKEGDNLNYVGPLIYAAIFSDFELYECNIQRLSAKVRELAEVYKGKIDFVKLRGCDSIIGLYLDIIIESTETIDNSYDFIAKLYPIVEQMDYENDVADCKIYPEGLKGSPLE